MTEIEIDCPHCGQHIKCDEGYRGMEINCPTCKQLFLIPTEQHQAPPSRIQPIRAAEKAYDINAPNAPVAFKVRIEICEQKIEGSEFQKWWGTNNAVPFKGKLTIGEGKLDFSGKQESVFGKPFAKQFPLSEIVNVDHDEATVTFDCANDGKIYMTGLAVHAANSKEAATIAALLPSGTTTEFVEKQGQKAAFVSALSAVTPVVFVTQTIVGLNVLMYAIMGIAGVGWFSPEPARMVSWGADFWPLTTDGEWWRLLTNTFLHFGLAHLGFNMVALLSAGTFTERLFGNKSFASIYLFGMVISSIGSDWWYHNDKVVSAGASGAIFAVYGALLAYLAFQSNSFPKDAVKPLITNAVVFVGYNVFYGAAHEGISNAAHLTGLAAGFLSGAAFCRPLDAARRNAQAIPRFIIGTTVCLTVITALLCFMPKSHGLTTEDLRAQIEDSIKRKFSENADTRSIHIKSFGLVHENGNKYIGLLTAQEGNTTEKLDVDVTYDGQNMIWKIIPSSIPDVPEPIKTTEPIVTREVPIEPRPRMEEQPKPETVQTNWNKDETDAMENGNIPFAIRTILAKPALRKQAKAQEPEMVAKTPWKYYGQVLKLAGEVAVVQDFPAGSDFGQAIGGQEGSDIVIESEDGTIVEMFCMKGSGRMKVGDMVNLYGYPAGVTEVPNRLGGNDVHLILVGNDYDERTITVATPQPVTPRRGVPSGPIRR